MDRLDIVVRGLLCVCAAALVWLLLHPPAAGSRAAAGAGERPLPSLAPVAALAAAGEAPRALRELAEQVRKHPALADRNGPLDTDPTLRNLVLNGWKAAVEGAEDRDADLDDLRFLQRRLAGGCS